jgi:hypothetical protein
MLLQITGSTPPTPWYKENPFVASATVVCAFCVAWLTPMFNRWAIWAAWLPMSYLLWCALQGSGWPSYFSKSRNRLFLGEVLILILVGLTVWKLDAWSLRLMNRKWRLESCSVVEDKRWDTGRGLLVILHGPTTIKAISYQSSCEIPVGAEFERDRGMVCLKGYESINDCFMVESETN